MNDPLPSAVAFTPSDAVLLAYQRFAAVPGASHQLKNRSTSLTLMPLPLLVAAPLVPIGAAAAVCIYLTVGVWKVVVVALFAGALGIVFLLRQTISLKLKNLWAKMKAADKRRDGTVNPFQREIAVLDEPLAMALVSSALLANESAGVAKLVLVEGVLQAAPLGAGTFWPADSLEDRLRRNRQLPVAQIVEDWLASSSDVPYRRAVELAEQGMVIRGLAVLSEAAENPAPVLTVATRLAASTIDGSAASHLIEACRRERPQVWQALQTALAAAFQKRKVTSEYNFGRSGKYSAEISFSRDAPLGIKVVKTSEKYASEVDPNPVQLLEAGERAVGGSTALAPASARPEDYEEQGAIAAKLPSWVVWLIHRFKGFLSPSSSEVGAAIKARVEAQKSAATDRCETVDLSPSTPTGQQENIPMRIFSANELPPPTAAHREFLDRASRDWARVLRKEKERNLPLPVELVHKLWRGWRRRRARARLLKQMPKPYRLLMLRVFGSPSYDDLVGLIQPWRRVGVIQHLEGFDTIGTRPEAIKAVKAGRIDDVLVATKEQVERELSALSLKPDQNELLFERQAFQCTNTTWQLAVRGMMDGADAVVMDLSSLSPMNQGCAWEIGQLLDRVPLARVTLLVNDSTDLQCLQTILDAAARRIAETSPNRDDSEVYWRLVRIGGLAARQPNESYFDWKRRIDTRLEPEILTSFLMKTAEPRRA